MKIQKLKSESKGEVIFAISEVKPSFVNALRRAFSFEVPVLAMEDIYFVNNSSALYDEIISHRLGLIPLTTDTKTYEFKETCTCKGEGCAKCTVKLALKVAGPKMVKAKDLKSTDPTVKPVFPEIPIVELLEGQELEFEAIAELGEGKTHAKWCAGHAFYHMEEGKKDTFKFTLEPWGQLSASDIFKQAVNILNHKIKELKIK
ncbi:DNA-directed RNA polymerase subunit D [Candidatus Woesearchaeota archaeon]|jgi:DNA-directed RNA polymerase subunit D|nr:DNA-directed RNA polymerase subunit D [Candidatus Woesearchaeota archaeon]MBT4114702.1 DNA-directed RNA polymerase subunit D [Candidatus Woesearchaeota archaeon]MBT4248158.1 DNA-directed RNA polymerase subunit D [Candidatus Woesearchaeota archaeon]